MRRYILMQLFCCAFLTAAFAQPGTTPAKPAPKPEGPANTESEFEKRYQERITKDRLYGIYIPKNLDDALVTLDKNISAESQAKIKGIPEDSVCAALHSRLGQWMILNWGFYEGSRLSHYLRSAGVTYPDDMADFLLLTYHRHLHGKPIELKEMAQYYREKRKKEFQEERTAGKVISEEVKQKPKPAAETAAPATASPAKSTAKPATKPATTSKGKG